MVAIELKWDDNPRKYGVAVDSIAVGGETLFGIHLRVNSRIKNSNHVKHVIESSTKDCQVENQ